MNKIWVLFYKVPRYTSITTVKSQKLKK